MGIFKQYPNGKMVMNGKEIMLGSSGEKLYVQSYKKVSVSDPNGTSGTLHVGTGSGTITVILIDLNSGTSTYPIINISAFSRIVYDYPMKRVKVYYPSDSAGISFRYDYIQLEATSQNEYNYIIQTSDISTAPYTNTGMNKEQYYAVVVIKNGVEMYGAAVLKSALSTLKDKNIGDVLSTIDGFIKKSFFTDVAAMDIQIDYYTVGNLNIEILNAIELS